jgi:hypothetical protein
MGRHKKVVPSIGKHMTIPQDLLAKVELELWSEAEGKVPHGAWQELQIELLTEWLVKRQVARGKREAAERFGATEGMAR